MSGFNAFTGRPAGRGSDAALPGSVSRVRTVLQVGLPWLSNPFDVLSVTLQGRRNFTGQTPGLPNPGLCRVFPPGLASRRSGPELTTLGRCSLTTYVVLLLEVQTHEPCIISFSAHRIDFWGVLDWSFWFWWLTWMFRSPVIAPRGRVRSFKARSVPRS